MTDTNEKTGKGTVVLAFSGGLDTSICVPILKNMYGYDRVVTVAADVGQPESEVKMATDKGNLIADKHYTLDLKDAFVKNHVFPAIKANALYEGYPMGTSLARPIIAEEIVKIAKKENAAAIGHGCTGKGNDQLRFDYIFRMHGFDIVAPMREHNMTREWEIDYAEQNNVPIPVKKSTPWSVDENIWSRSIEGGRLEEPDYHPPEEIYHWTAALKDTPNEPEIVTIGFENGVPVSLNGKKMSGVELIVTLNKLAGKHSVGRNDMVEDRVLGLKARENYEHPAATVLIAAHKDLEKLVLSRAELKFKNMVDDQWAELAYMGLIHEPLYHDLNAFINKTQERVTGTVDVQLYKGGLHIMGRASPNAIYSMDMVSFDSTTIDQRDAIGYSKYFGIQGRMLWQLQNK
ncbi:argininosuccinate synthase [Methanocorpusculum labreanum Z]|uniref:Argininosuccinate synthase n=1 Tax=Methanocorpusculum labreanum (strain ATCC 43576 / DSM 4855 / Z) TaxID=410358 RepID=A2ST04_METLZ|nr:argininosuccinate synthase [Methanocorpusculum labreanum]ABN07460.1 argininosuccinate synthase [Methanocorpusculum labreanum Z]